MDINKIRFIPATNAVDDVYTKATGMPFVGEMMVAAAGQEPEPTPDPDPDPTPDPDPEAQYVLQYLNPSAVCDEDAGCFWPVVECTILSKVEMTDEEITYGWNFEDQQTYPSEEYEDYDNHFYKADGSYLITNENYSLYDVDEQYIGWYWTEYINEDSKLFMGEEGQEATYTIYLNGNSIGSRDKESVTPECDAKCE